jgi:XTP/dITP diphosphohydrolase
MLSLFYCKGKKHMDSTLIAFGRLLKIMDELREQCPWDQKQTMQSLRTLSIEELYELSDAILTESPDDIRKELGDLFLHLVFYARIGREKNWFTLDQVLNGICDKLIQRHPHIYGDVQVQNDQEVKRNWEQIKLREGNTSVLGGVPAGLPALVKCWRLQEKAAGVGFDWEKPEQVWEKVKEELHEFEEARANQDLDNQEEEMGDMLFALVNYARLSGINPEDALERTNRKFIHRVQGIESWLRHYGQTWGQVDISITEGYYQRIKRGEFPPETKE